MWVGIGRMKVVWMMMALINTCMAMITMAVKAAENPHVSSPSPSPLPHNWSPRVLDAAEKPKRPKRHLPPKLLSLCHCVMHCDETCKTAGILPAYLACFFVYLPIKCRPWSLDVVDIYDSISTAFRYVIYQVHFFFS